MCGADHRADRHPDPAGGIISACAEQTGGVYRTGTRARDHLRVCGADRLLLLRAAGRVGSSPRVRSRPAGSGDGVGELGIISACAEQTLRKCSMMVLR